MSSEVTGHPVRILVTNLTHILISLKAPGFFFVGDLCSAVERRKQKLFAVKRRKQNHKFRISVYGLYVSKTTFLNRIPVLEKRAFTRAQKRTRRRLQIRRRGMCI